MDSATLSVVGTLVSAMIGGLGTYLTTSRTTARTLRVQTEMNLARWLTALGPDRFTRPLREIALQLGRTRSLVNYQRRRQALRDWALTTREWDHIASRLPPVPGPIQPILDDRKRQESSAFIWARVTQGEPRFAPRPIEVGQPEPVRKNWAPLRSNTWHKLAQLGRIVHYAELRKLLIEHASHLANRIDGPQINGPWLDRADLARATRLVL